jgi:hypothetical protein
VREVYWLRWAAYKARAEVYGKVTPTSQKVWDWYFPIFIEINKAIKEARDGRT